MQMYIEEVQENARLRSHLLEHIKLYFMYKNKRLIRFYSVTVLKGRDYLVHVSVKR